MTWLPFLIWLGTFGIALTAILKGSDLFIDNLRVVSTSGRPKVRLLGTFALGCVLVLPELSVAITATVSGHSTFAVATASGAVITNLLLVVGFIALTSDHLSLSRRLIRTEGPFLVIALTFFIAVLINNGEIDQFEGLFLVLVALVYIWYHRQDRDLAPTLLDDGHSQSLEPMTMIAMLLGLTVCVIGAKYMISAVQYIAPIIGVSTNFVALTGVAVGTALPELFLASRALRRGLPEVALGSVVVATALNLLLVPGLSAFIRPLKVDQLTFSLGLGFSLAATAIIFALILSRRIWRWEGFMLVLLFLFFLFTLGSAL